MGDLLLEKKQQRCEIFVAPAVTPSLQKVRSTVIFIPSRVAIKYYGATHLMFFWGCADATIIKAT